MALKFFLTYLGILFAGALGLVGERILHDARHRREHPGGDAGRTVQHPFDRDPAFRRHGRDPESFRQHRRPSRRSRRADLRHRRRRHVSVRGS